MHNTVREYKILALQIPHRTAETLCLQQGIAIITWV
jgi:hypothetical protein